MKLTKIDPKKDLNAKAREMYNFHKVAAVLADYGYTGVAPIKPDTLLT